MTKIICVECQEEFELTEGWKKLMEERPEVLPPKRCYRCRQKRKAEKERGKTGHSFYFPPGDRGWSGI